MSAVRIGGGLPIDIGAPVVLRSGPTPGPQPVGYPGALPPTPDNLIPGARQSPGSVFGAAESTNPLVSARFAPAIKINPITLRGPITGGDRGWMQLAIDRPSFLWPTGYLTDGSTVNLPQYEVLYAPIAIPLLDSQALRSARRGIAYLSNPGIWWVKYNAPAAATAAVLNALVIDANDPAVASRYLSEPGCNGFNGPTTTVAAIGTAAICMPANPYRKSVTVQGVPGAGSPIVRIGIGGVAADWNAGNVGLRLITGSFNSMTFAGDSLALEDIFCVAEAGSGAAGAVVAVEYF